MVGFCIERCRVVIQCEETKRAAEAHFCSRGIDDKNSMHRWKVMIYITSSLQV